MNNSTTSPTKHPLLGGSCPYGPATPLSPPEYYFGAQPFAPPAPTTRQNSFHKSVKRIVYRLWLMELIGICVSIIILGMLFLVLTIFDRRNVDDVGFFSNVPTGLITSLTSVMRTAMLLPVATALSQMQWSWFKEERPLSDLETFNGATRGVIGALVLLRRLTKRRFWHFAMVGALLTVASLALETVVGSAMYITIKGDPLPGNSNAVTVPRTNRYTWSLLRSSGQELGDQIPIPVMIAAIDRGLSEGTSYGNLVNANQALLTPSCDSGYCDFGTYQSIGVDHICEDISSNVVTTSDSYYLASTTALPNPLRLDAESGLINSTVSFQYPDSSVFQQATAVGPLIANVFMLLNSFKDAPPIGVECVLFWTVYTFNSSIVASSWDENIIENFTDWTSTAKQAAINPKQNVNITMEPQDCWINRTLYEDHGFIVDSDGFPECINHVGAEAQLALQNWMSSSTYGFLGSYTENPNSTSGGNETPFILYLAQLLMESNTTLAASDIDQYIFPNLAAAMTDTIRFLPRKSFITTEGSYWVWSAGIMFDSWRFHVHWRWMAFPVLLVFGSTLFSFYVAITSRQNLWKNSSLPLLFHGLVPREGDMIGELDDYYDMKEKATEMKVKLSNDAHGHIRFVEAGQPDMVMRD